MFFKNYGFVIFVIIIIILLFMHYYQQKDAYLKESFKNKKRVKDDTDDTNDTDNTNDTDDTERHNKSKKETNNGELKDLNIEFVIARYNEDVDFLLHNEFINRPIYLYNKGPKINNPSIINAKNIKIIKLPNVGKCDHTYLYHIVNNYNDLADLTVFLPASYYYMDYKRIVANKIISKSVKNNKPYFPAKRFNRSNYKELYNFKLNEYKTSFNANLVLKEKNKNYDMVLSKVRPYGRWIESIFDINNNNNNNIYKCNYVIYWGIFSAKKDMLKKYDIDIYKKLLSYVDKDINPEAGHYIERIWAPIFYPFNANNIV